MKLINWRVTSKVVVIGIVVVAIAAWWQLSKEDLQLEYPAGQSSPAALLDKDELSADGKNTIRPVSEIEYVGPRENLPAEAPSDYGFWSFAIPAPNVLSRSGQPLISGYEWLKKQGWQSVVNLRVDGERGEVADDAKLPGFRELDFNYLHLPITDGHPPSEERAKQFLQFVTDPVNQPVHVHCRGGIGRAGTMTALYRYAVHGWPMKNAIEESRAFRGGVSSLQKRWLLRWAERYPAGHHEFLEARDGSVSKPRRGFWFGGEVLVTRSRQSHSHFV